MSRVTVEDCIEVVPNRFELVLYAAQRAKDISAGASLTIPRDRDKNPVVSLREIAERTITTSVLQESIVKGMQQYRGSDDSDAEDVESILAEDESLSRALQMSEADFANTDGFTVSDGEDAAA
ncbi:MAG: DNA-directed RNA polymerase subunit omega [Alphaproteobacteria bacterium]|jgi:DNA-directed RNA polymerase subunit omega|nr:DNA-directed RNA polymerase subunit omega [Alphaproteobacteria bacterium]